MPAALAATLLMACDCGGATDATLDAGTPDASVEAGPRDATPPSSDAGRDAALRDAATDGGTGDAGEPPTAPEVQALLDAFCANEVRCANRAIHFIDVDWCHPYWLGERPALWSAGLAAGRLAAGATYDDCLAALATVCADLAPTTCVKPFDGLVAEDGDCHADGECQEGLACLSEGTCPRTCQPPRSEGDLCGARWSCEPAGYCVLQFGSTWRDTYCEAYGEPGDPCETVNDCGEDGYCDTTDMICHAKVGLGDPCEATSGVLAMECPARSVCVPDDAGTERCTALGDLEEGDPCGFGGFADPCPGDLACGGSGPVVCMRGVAIGEPCGTERPCTSASRCVAGVCVSVSAPGEPCGSNAVCTSEHYCDDSGRCRRQPVGGEPCGEGVPCTDRSRCDRTTDLCRPRGSPGDPCGSSSQCLTECNETINECGPLYGEGQRCHYEMRECAAGLECREDAEGRSRCQSPCRP